jgi:hypothetical protein
MAWAASGASIVDVPPGTNSLRLACTGTMATNGGQTEGAVIVSGVVDLGSGSVSGFGLGGQEIRSVTPTTIAFGNAAVGDGLIDGLIDRQTYEVSIVVHATGRSPDPVIAMALACRPSPPLA